MREQSSLDDCTPILVGGGRITQRKVALGAAMDPVTLMSVAAERALSNAAAGAGSRAALSELGAVAMVSMQLELRLRLGGRDTPLYRNAPRDVARRLGAPRVAAGAGCFVSAGDSGHSPQMLVNEMSTRIAAGELRSALVVGCEVLGTFMRAAKQGYSVGGAAASVRDISGRVVDGAAEAGAAEAGRGAGEAGPKVLRWGDAASADDGDGGAPVPEPTVIGGEEQGLVDAPIATVHEARHGLVTPINVYAMVEQALRHEEHPGRSEEEHRGALGELFAPFTEVAAALANAEHAWFPTRRSPAELATPSAANRLVSTPYTKYMNAIMDVDQAAALLLMSVGEARRLGVPQERWVFLHGCADASEWPAPVSERRHLHRSFAMEDVGRRVVQSANVPLARVRHFDIYSCFPAAVQIACREMGLPVAGGRATNGAPLTVCGGLPYHGGPGNNYSTHAIAAMLDVLRAPAHRGEFGLVTANGGFLSKHSAGIYSTTPYADTHPASGGWEREPSAVSVAARQAALVARCERENRADVAAAPTGAGTLEHTTVEHGRDGPVRAVSIGTMLPAAQGGGADAGRRFLATSRDPAVLRWLLAADRAGETVDVRFDTQQKRAFLAPSITSASKL